MEPIHVDHSIPAAYGFIIQTSDSAIAYMGDFRLHGPRKEMSEEFLQKIGERRLDALICEGTRMALQERRMNYSEKEVEERCSEIVASSGSVVFATRYSKDMDRLRSIYNAAARNIGAAGASGACIMMISGDEGTVMAVDMNFTELNAGEEVAFQAFWDTSNATEGAIYQAMAYISCEGTSSLPKSCLISTNRFPIAAISFSPAAAWTGLNVTFDASASYDPDGNIAAFIWEFGDFSSFEGALVNHSYAVPGNYTVTLTVVDEKGAEGRATARIEVVRGFFLNVSSNIGVPVEGAGLYPEGGLARAIAQHEVPVPGVMGRLGAKYVFKHWAGASDATAEIVDIEVNYEASRSGLVAIYEERTDMTFYVMLVVLVAAVVAVVAVALRSRSRGKSHNTQ